MLYKSTMIIWICIINTLIIKLFSKLYRTYKKELFQHPITTHNPPKIQHFTAFPFPIPITHAIPTYQIGIIRSYNAISNPINSPISYQIPKRPFQPDFPYENPLFPPTPKQANRWKYGTSATLSLSINTASFALPNKA